METDTPSVLLPCAICARTFMPRSLEKHVKICERATTKKRKPFDSAKQRIQGTDLAEFLPRQERKRSLYEEKRKSSWKETHDDFLRTIRAARGRTSDESDRVKQQEQAGQRQCSSHASSGVPTRANEKGTCPTCNRRFGVKAYERHVAWCKERSTRLPNNFPPTNNVAKERLEARMKYRAPILKNRRTTNREKYSQGSASAPNIVAPTSKTGTPIESIRGTASRSNLSRTRDTLSVGDARRSDKSTESQRTSTVTTTGRGEPSTQTPILTEATERTNTAKRSSRSTSSGACKEYDPFLLAERQMHDLLRSDSSDLSPTVVEDGLSDRTRKGPTKRRESLYPLSHSSAFVDYPSRDQILSTGLDKRSTIQATSTGDFDELASDFSSDSTETNSLSREIFLRDFHDSKERVRQKENSPNGRARSESSKRELGRRMILDKSIVLGNEIVQEDLSNRNERRSTNVKLKPSKVLRSLPNRSQPVRAYSAPKSMYERNNKTNDGNRDSETLNNDKRDRENASNLDNDRKNDYITLSGSDLSLNSIVSSEVDIKRSNSVFDELITSFEDNVLGNDSFPSLRSLLRNESLRPYDNSPVHGTNTRQQEDRISDEEYSSPDNYKQQEQKFNADSAYSSLNRKSNYSNHGRSTNDGPNRFEDNSSRNNRRENQTTSISAGKTKCRMSRFCHECGSKFPETAKFCCQCGVKRLTL